METCVVRGEREREDAILEACRQGDREAFQRLFDAYKDKVYSLAVYALHGDRAAAEDVTQEVFVRLFTRLDQFRREADFATWLYRIVANACVDEQRRRGRLVPLSDLEQAGAVDAGQPPEWGYVRTEIKKALSNLPPDLRMTLLLRYFEELSYDEMARVLTCSKGTVASRLHRGLKLLARKLAHLDDTAASKE